MFTLFPLFSRFAKGSPQGKASAQGQSSPPTQSRPLRLETLESRRLLTFGPSGGETLLNQQLAGAQEYVQLAVDDQGNTVAVWESAGQDGDDTGIFGRRFDSQGQPLGNEFQINTTTAGRQYRPVVDILADGGFVVAWTGSDGSGTGIFGQRFDALGQPVNGELALNSYTADSQYLPSVAALAGGGFVATWSSLNQIGNDLGVFARRFDAAGQPLAPEFHVNVDFNGSNGQHDPFVAAGADGRFVIAWGGWQGRQLTDIQAQRYAADGSPLGANFPVNTHASSYQSEPVVAIAPNGDFVIVWHSHGQDGSGTGIYAQRYSASGSAQGAEFLVNTYTPGDQASPSVAYDDAGDFLISWFSNGQDGSAEGIYAQRFAADGTRLGGEFRVNTTTAGTQGRNPGLASWGAGNYVIGWHGNGIGDADGVFAQRYTSNAPPIADAGGPYSIREGQSLTLDGLQSNDPDGDSLTFAWELNGDGLFDDAVGAQPTLTWSQLIQLGWDDNGSHTVQLRATDPSGATDGSQASVTILNAPPTLSISAPLVVVPGENFTLQLAATDPSPRDAADLFLYAIDWDGDGSIDETVQSTSSLSANHAFPTAGSFAISAWAEDKDGGRSATQAVRVEVQTARLEQGVLIVGGSVGGDEIKIKTARGGKIKLHFKNVLRQKYAGVQQIVVYGQDGDDKIHIGNSVTVDAHLFGGLGDDHLRGGRGDDLLDGGPGDDLLKGGRGNDILQGGEGSDVLLGGGGRDLLIGGRGSDLLQGGREQDLLVAGYTDFDGNQTMLEAIRASWSRPLQYGQRLADLRGPAFNFREGETLHDDGAVDELEGDSGRDALFSAPLDLVNDRRRNEFWDFGS